MSDNILHAPRIDRFTHIPRLADECRPALPFLGDLADIVLQDEIGTPDRVAELARSCGTPRKLRELASAALSHAGNEADAAHGFFDLAGLAVDNVDGHRRGFFLRETWPGRSRYAAPTDAEGVARAFLAELGLVVECAPCGDWCLVLAEQPAMTFGRTSEGEMCDESDLALPRAA
jgi:hypothetical protein